MKYGLPLFWRQRSRRGWRSCITLFIGCFSVMALLLLVITWMHATIVLTSWASSVALLLTAPDARSTRPYRIFGCHVVSALIGAGLALVSGNAFTISTPTRSFLLISLLGAGILGAAGSILRKRSVV